MDDLREKVARAMAATFNGDADPQGDLWEQWGGETVAVLAAIHASGHRIVPVEPTEDMVFAAMTHFDTPFCNDVETLYRVMLTAYGQKGE